MKRRKCCRKQNELSRSFGSIRSRSRTRSEAKIRRCMKAETEWQTRAFPSEFTVTRARARPASHVLSAPRHTTQGGSICAYQRDDGDSIIDPRSQSIIPQSTHSMSVNYQALAHWSSCQFDAVVHMRV